MANQRNLGWISDRVSAIVEGRTPTWWWIAFVGVFGTVLPFGLYNKGISLLSATRASITATLEPVIAGLIAYLFLGETMEIMQVIGAGSVIASILLLQTRQARR